MNTMKADEKMKQSDIPTTTNGADMAATLGISARQLRQLVSEGRIEGKVARDQYDVRRTIQTYLAYCRGHG